MGTYNTSTTRLTCLRCGRTEVFVVDLYCGHTAMMVEVPLGTPYPFCIGQPPERGGPPAGGSSVEMGYTECPGCHRDFCCLVVIQDGILISISPDSTRLPLIPDSESVGQMACPNCLSPQTRLQAFEGFEQKKLICDVCHEITTT